MPTAIDALDNANKRAGLDAFLGPNIINVRHEGATGDGVTDDRAAIVSALTKALAALPATVYFPPGEYVISNGIPVEPAQGAGGLTISGAGPNASKILFSGASAWTNFFAFDIEPGSTPTVGTLSDYLNDITVRDLGFFDDDPATHAGGDQTHAISIGYCVNAVVDNCSFDSIGDEAVSFKYVRGGRIVHNHSENTPSLGTEGGCITVQHGSADVSLSDNVLWGSPTFGTQSSVVGSKGIHVELLTTDDVHSIHIANNSLRDFADEGILLNTSAVADLYNVTVNGNTIDNCDYGIRKIGTSGNLRDSLFIGNTLKDIQNTGFDFDAGKTNTFDLTLSSNIIENCGTSAMKLQITRAFLSNNLSTDCARGFHIFNGDYVNIVGGIFDNCGGSLQEEIEVETGVGVVAVGVLVTNSNSSSACFKGLQEVRDCVIERSGASNPENAIFSCQNVIGCVIEGGIRPTANVNGGIIANNKLIYNDTGGANSAVGIIIAGTNHDYRVMNNLIDLSGSTNNQRCLDIQSGATGTLVVGNILKAKDADLANAYLNSGTGTVADFTNNNIST